MQIALLQNNPKLGSHTDNAASLVSMVKNLELTQNTLCLTSSFALCGNPWKALAHIGGFLDRAQQAIDLIPQLDNKLNHSFLAQSFHTTPLWVLKGNIQNNSFGQKNFEETSFEINSIRFFAPHNIAHTSLDKLQVPKNAQIVYLANADRFYEGLDLEAGLIHFAKRIKLPVVYVNTCGASDGIIYAGQSMLITQKGEVLARLQTFEEDSCVFEFDGENLKCAYKITPILGKDAALFMGASLAIRDYAKKSGMGQALIGISGGMDSALVAALACEALGAENVLGLMMPSKYSSEHSLADATLLMKNLGVTWHTIPITAITDAFEKTLEPSFSCLAPLKNPEADLTPDNIQARTRGNLLMAFANRTSRMVIGTSNKSEAAMGYCTLYGDTVGALEPISDIYKTRTYDIAKWYNTWKKSEIIPENIFTKAPSAELRPNQKDEETLPPYPVIDRVLEQILEKGIDPNIIADPELSPEDKHIILTRLIASEFKRKQSPFVVALSSCAFGHDWNAPITSKAF